MKKQFKILLLMYAITCINTIYSVTPLGMFVPYDMNIRLKKPAENHFYFDILGEKSYNVKGYATDECQEKSFLVDSPLQIYEQQQNLVSLYQGFDEDGNIIQTYSTPFTQLIDDIAGGPGGGVSNFQNGLFTPTGKLSCGQVAFSGMYGLKHHFYISTYLPVYFAKLDCIDWNYSGNNQLFSGEKIQNELVDSFMQDAENIFNLNIDGWEQHGVGDLAFLIEWQQDFPQRRAILRSVQPNIRLGITLPTGKRANESLIMAMPFGADGSVGIPFGGGLGINLANHVEVGFNGQFWYFWSNEKCRRFKTFPTQTSLLYPIEASAIREYSFTQNFNLYAQVYSLCKRLTLKFCYQYWRRGEDKITPTSPYFNQEIVSSDLRLEETTQHKVMLALTYSPLAGDFKKIAPQIQLFWKGAVKGSRAAIASTAGAQFAIIF